MLRVLRLIEEVAVLVPPQRRPGQLRIRPAPQAADLQCAHRTDRRINAGHSRRIAWRPLTSYIDSSAAAKLLVNEAESAALATYLSGLGDQRLAGSYLLETGLRRFATRSDVPQTEVTELLDAVRFVEADRLLFLQAGLLPGKHLCSPDALHTATALRIEADEFLTYDTRQAETARSVGLQVISPT